MSMVLLQILIKFIFIDLLLIYNNIVNPTKEEFTAVTTEENLLKIGEVAKKAGVTLRTLRYYHELGLIQPAERSSGNFRLYNEHSIAIIKLISNLKDLGFSLEEIKQLLIKPENEDETYIATINRTKEVLMAEKMKVEEKLEQYKKISNDIDTSLDIIEKCIECRLYRGENSPCRPGCPNCQVHIRL